MPRVSVPLPDLLFDLNLTLNCGQVFHWDAVSDGFEGAIGEQPVRLKLRAERVWINADAAEIAENYFAFDHPLEKIYAAFPPDDTSMRQALAACRGLRIIRQPKWECLATFITSSMKQVAHIRTMSKNLRARYGRRLNSKVSGYPSPGKIAKLQESDVRNCGLGFRAPNLLKTARMIHEGQIDLDAITLMDTPRARQELLRCPGVGEKIANCVLLFAYERLDAVPVDVWIAKVLRELYFDGDESVGMPRLAEFSATHFGPYAGYAQQYLFHHARSTFRRSSKLNAQTWANEKPENFVA